MSQTHIRTLRRFAERALSLLLTAVIIFGALPLGMLFSGLANPPVAAALPTTDQAIFNYPSKFDPPWQPGDSVTLSTADIEWGHSITHTGYDRALTSKTSKQFNGFESDDHVVFDGDTVRFLGYDQPRNMDMVFAEDYMSDFSRISFNMHPIVMNFHTFSEAGLLFNGSFDSTGRYTGYMVLGL